MGYVLCKQWGFRARKNFVSIFLLFFLQIAFKKLVFGIIVNTYPCTTIVRLKLGDGRSPLRKTSHSKLPSKIEHIIGVDSDAEAQQDSKHIAQYAIMQSNLSMRTKFANYSAAKLHHENYRIRSKNLSF